jgi:ubiquinone/menaquinone biosynthesis C-methylase UbiE
MLNRRGEWQIRSGFGLQTRLLTKKTARQLLTYNVRVNGLRSVIYCYGLSASRYIEYVGALCFLLQSLNQDRTILDLGCGHSILPTLLQTLGARAIAVDSNKNALKWQVKKSKELAGELVDVVLADIRCLPFRDTSIPKVSCISSIEHVPSEGDVEAASEMGRILKSNGLCVITVPMSSNNRSHVKNHWAADIPMLLQRLFRPCLPTVLMKFNVDRTCHYFERFFSQEDINQRIVRPTRCVRKDYFTLKSGNLVKFVHQTLVPTGVLTLLEFLIARFLVVSKQIREADAIILKLEKARWK